MARLLERGLRDRVRLPDDPLELRVAGGIVTLERDEVQGRIRDSLQLPYSTSRQRMRGYLRNEVSRQTGQVRTPDETTESLLERIWPKMTAASFLQELLGSESRLISAAGDDFPLPMSESSIAGHQIGWQMKIGLRPISRCLIMRTFS
jgi:hypothetical protein